MPIMLEVSFPAPAKALTLNQRLHWAERAKRTKAWRTRACEETRSAIERHGFSADRVHVVVTLSFADGRRRDVHNWLPTVKACIDGMVDAGLVPDDDDTYLVGPDLRRGRTAKREAPYLHFEVRPIG